MILAQEEEEKCPVGEYTSYIINTWEPLLEQLRSAGKITHCKLRPKPKNLPSANRARNIGKGLIYKGEIDQDGNAFGLGTAVDMEDPRLKVHGTFKRNSLHGLCKPLLETELFIPLVTGNKYKIDETRVGEFRNGVRHGKGTNYLK